MGAHKNEAFFATAILRNCFGFKKSKRKKYGLIQYQVFSYFTRRVLCKIFNGKYW